MIVCKSSAELDTMHRAGIIVWEVLNELRMMVAPGISTAELDRVAESRATEHRARPAFKGYRGYPASLCVSINEEVVHGIPSPSRKLREGEIVSLDYGVELDGYFGDAAVTVPVGKVSPELKKLMRVTRESLDRAIEAARPGNRLSDVGSSVQQWVEQNGFSVVREFVGHGIGTRMHEEPSVLNYGKPGTARDCKRAWSWRLSRWSIEGAADVRVLNDGWTAVTADGKPSAHFEHTVAITAAGPRILTRPAMLLGHRGS